MERFTIQREELEEGAYAVAVAGEIDLHAAPALKRELLDIASRAGRTTIIADLAGATLFDATPLGVLLAVNKRLESTGATLFVVCNEALLALVARTGVDQILNVASSRQALVSSPHACAAA